MTTIERAIESPTELPVVVAPRRRPWITVLVAVVALIVGAGIGWVVRGGDEDPTAVVAGGGSLSDRQAEMVDVAEDYVAAWVANDYDKVASLMTPDGIVVTDEVSRVDDGTLEQFVTGFGFSSLTAVEPYLVYETSILVIHTYQGQPALTALTFTETGPVLIEVHEMFDAL